MRKFIFGFAVSESSKRTPGINAQHVEHRWLNTKFTKPVTQSTVVIGMIRIISKPRKSLSHFWYRSKEFLKIQFCTNFIAFMPERVAPI